MSRCRVNEPLRIATFSVTNERDGFGTVKLREDCIYRAFCQSASALDYGYASRVVVVAFMPHDFGVSAIIGGSRVRASVRLVLLFMNRVAIFGVCGLWSQFEGAYQQAPENVTIGGGLKI